MRAAYCTGLGFGEIMHAAQVLKMRVLRPQRGTKNLRGGIDQAVGHRQTIAGRGHGDGGSFVNHAAALHEQDRPGGGVRPLHAGEILVDLLHRDDRHNQVLGLGNRRLKKSGAGAAIKHFQPAR